MGMDYAAERYGVAGISPYGRDVGTSFFTSAKGMGDIVGKYYQNEAEAMKNQLTRDTLASAIEKANTVNRADTQYYPQEKLAGLNKTNAEVRELQARAMLGDAQAQEALRRISSGFYEAQVQELQSRANLGDAQAKEALDRVNAGLYKAQANEARARGYLYGEQGDVIGNETNPTVVYDRLMQEYRDSPPNSVRRNFVVRQINDLLSTGSVSPGGRAPTTRVAGVGQGTNPRMSYGAIGENGIELNPLGGSNRSSFHQGAITNPDGTVTTIESPTTTSASTAQMRDAAEAEVKVLYPVVSKGLNHYSGPLGSIKLTKDLIAYNATGDPKAQQRLYEFEIAKRLRPDLASMIAKQQSGLNPGIEAIREFTQNFPGVPGGPEGKSGVAGYIPQSIHTMASQGYLPIQQAATQAAINVERSGFPQTQSTPPLWSGGVPSMGLPPGADETDRQLVSDLNALQPAPTAPATTTQEPERKGPPPGKVAMYAPDGSYGYVPEKELKDAIKQGYKVAK